MEGCAISKSRRYRRVRRVASKCEEVGTVGRRCGNYVCMFWPVCPPAGLLHWPSRYARTVVSYIGPAGLLAWGIQQLLLLSGRAISLERLYRVKRRQSPLPTVATVVCRCRRRCRGERRQRGSYREPDRENPWARLVLSRNRQDTMEKMSHLAKFLSGEEYGRVLWFLANQPGRYTRRPI